MEMQQLLYFKTIAELQSIKKASEVLHISQPSLSVSLAKLESELGVQLFDRINRTIRLNSLGHIFLEHTYHVFNELREAEIEMKDGMGPVPNIIHFASTTHGLCNDLIKIYMKSHPETTFHYYSHGVDTVLESLKNGSVDFAVANAPVHSPQIEWQPLMNETLALVICENHPFTKRTYIDLEDLQDEKLIVQNSSIGKSGEHDDIFRKSDINTSNVFFTNEMEAAFAAAELGVGSFVVSYLTAQRLLQNPTHTAKIVPLRTPYYANTVGILMLKGHYLTVPVKRFHQFVLDYFTELAEKQKLEWSGIPPLK